MKHILKTGLCLVNLEDSCHGDDEYIYWTHANCGGRGFVDANAEVECQDCHVRVGIENLSLKCPNHTFSHTIYKGSAQETIWYFASNFAVNIEPPDDFYVKEMKYNLAKRIGPQKIGSQALEI